jgi:hypothetical protein
MKGGPVVLCSIVLILCGLFVGVESIGTWSTEFIPMPRWALSAASVGSYAIFVGGWNQTNSPPMDRMDWYHVGKQVR